MTREDEKQLIEAILNGETDKYELLVKDNEKRIYNFMLRMTGNPEDAFDMAQEAFLSAYYRLETFEGKCAFGTWLYKIASNKCIDFLRRKRRKKERVVEISIDDETSVSIQLPDVRYNPENEIEKKELRDAVNRGVSMLPENYREIIIMREISELSYEEIANILDISIGTVKSRLSRGRKALAEYLVASGYFFDTGSSHKTKGE